MNVEAYLSRIGVDATSQTVNAATLSRLQTAHLMSVPFENLDIHWQRPITLDIAKFEDKIVTRRRGGFGYELNGLFNELLQVLGYQTRLVSARGYNGSLHGPEYDHAAIIVSIGEDEYLADVGFGNFTAEPLRFVTDVEQRDREGTFVIRRYDDDYLEVAKRTDDGWTSQYIFKDIARGLAEFVEMCDFQQYSPESHFTRGRVCSLMTETGRKTLTDKKFVVTSNGVKTETAIGSEDEFDRVLMGEFGIKAAASAAGQFRGRSPGG